MLEFIVDLLYFLKDRLRFIGYFYEAATSTFHETMRKIDAGEEPYIDRRDPEYVDEPAFLSEWQDAEIAIDVIGMTCLGMLQAAFQSFLREYLKEWGGEQALAQFSRMKQGSWFNNYRAVFAQSLGIDWGVSGVDLAFLEQIILTRNDFQHNAEIFTGYVYQSRGHAQKHPDTQFRDPGWPVSVFMPARLIVEKEKLERAVDAVHTLCRYLESVRHS